MVYFIERGEAEECRIATCFSMARMKLIIIMCFYTYKGSYDECVISWTQVILNSVAIKPVSDKIKNE